MSVSITTLNTNDSGATSRTVINTNFSNLNAGLPDLSLYATLASPTFTGTVVLPNNQSLTSPKIVTGINDTNNNELVKVTATASAINELTVANASIGTNPSITASGDDTNIGIDLTAKGTGLIQIKGNATQAGTLAIYEDTDDGSNYSAFRASPRASSITYLMPTADPNNGQVLSAGTVASNISQLSWISASSTKEFFVPISSRNNTASPYSAVGPESYSIGSIDTTGVVGFSFYTPSDFTSLTSIVVTMIPDATETITWDAFASFATNGQDAGTHADSDLNRTQAVTANQITECNIAQGNLATLFASLAASDYVGIQFQSDIADLRILGLRFKYA
jgi:hypothetical protein